MPKSLRFRHVLVTVLLTLSMLAQGTWALAGTTGGLNGTVVDTTSGAPVANAAVTAQAPSQTATTTTDSHGHFVFLSLAPDTYTVSSVKTGYDPANVAGITVFADSVQNVTVSMRAALRTIASVHSQAIGSLVKSGTTADVYSVNAATQDKVSALGGGGSLNSAYAAVASVPGVVMPLNQTGYFQTVHIRGGDYDQVGYEFDGVPVNRSFDNYPSGALSSLGMSELQVYTGATPANSEGQGLAGYINQVIKTGTFPGFGLAALSMGGPTFYHKASIEAGGASPNRLFSYYAGVGGYNQAFRYTNNSNASEYQSISPALAQLTPPDPNPDFDPSAFKPTDPMTFPCFGAPVDVNYAACYGNQTVGPTGYQLAPYNWASLANISDRDAVINLHFGIPHKNDAGRDDVQLLWNSALLHNSFYESTNDAGSAAFWSLSGGVPTYEDGYSYNGPVGRVLPTSQIAKYVSPYFFPSQPAHTFGSPIPADARDTIWNDQEIVKLQYQKNLGSNAYFRIYGYTYYSDWLQNGPVCAFASYVGCAASPDYELSSHTRGVSAQFADQLNNEHLLSVEANYTTANSTRDNNTQMFNGTTSSRGRAIVLVDPNNPTSGVCYQVNGTSATPTTCLNTAPADVRANWLKWSQVYASAQPAGKPLPDFSGVTCGTGPCSWFIAENSKYATYNQVVPKFTSVSLTDQWRPTTKLLVNLGVRADRFEFDGSPTNPNDPARQFWFNAFNLDNCVDSNGFLKPISTPGACPAGTTPAKLSNVSAQVNTYTKVQPRVSGTYTFNPNSVLRFSYGKYVEPPNAAFEQYNVLQENLAGFLGSHFYDFGFTTPGHEVRPPTSDNFDLSWEQHLKGTDWSFKLTPFLRKTKDQIQNFFLDQASGFVSGLNVGRQTSEGVEFQVNKGDFNQNGLSGMLSFTYTNSYINYDTLQNGTTIVSQINNDIKTYNAYTSFCTSNLNDPRCGTPTKGAVGSACYDSSGASVSCATIGAIANPYWNAPVQALLDPNAKYPTYDIFPGGVGGSANSFAVPYAAALVLNYKHDKFAITPSFQMLAGNRYGSPESMVGIDPAKGCTSLGTSPSGDPRYPYGTAGQAGGSAYDAIGCASTIPVPNMYTGGFDQPGAYVNPTQFLMNLQVSYDVSPKITLVGTVANLVNSCFGGTKKAWTIDDRNVCSYGINNSSGVIPPETNVYNPTAEFTGPQRLVQYPYGAYLGGVNVNGNASKNPLNLYLEARIKL